MKIFNHDIRGSGPASLRLGRMYASRALCITGKDDVIQLPSESKQHWEYIQSHYDRVGIECCDKVVWDLRLERVQNYPEAELSSFFFGERENYFRPDEKRRSITNLLNSKNHFIETARENGVTIPHTSCFESVEVFLNYDKKIKYPVYLKPAVSTSGLGIVYCEEADTLRKAITALDKDVVFQIQEKITTECFLSVQYEAIKGKAEKLLISNQIISNNSHAGNISPSNCEDVCFLDHLAQYAVNQGIKEIFAFDVAVSELNEEMKYYAIECNPRYTAASYPTLVAKKLGVSHWRSTIVKTPFRNFNNLDILDLEFNKTSGSGIVVITWGTIEYGKIMFMIIGSPEQQIDLLKEIKSRMK